MLAKNATCMSNRNRGVGASCATLRSAISNDRPLARSLGGQIRRRCAEFRPFQRILRSSERIYGAAPNMTPRKTKHVVDICHCLLKTQEGFLEGSFETLILSPLKTTLHLPLSCMFICSRVNGAASCAAPLCRASPRCVNVPPVVVDLRIHRALLLVHVHSTPPRCLGRKERREKELPPLFSLSAAVRAPFFPSLTRLPSPPPSPTFTNSSAAAVVVGGGRLLFFGFWRRR